MTSQPTTIGPYEVIREIGRGGMGVVYQARDTRLDREVAIKVLPEAMSRDKERVLRLEREGKLLASLNHSNIAQIYGFEVADKQKFLVLEYVEGETLSQRLKRGPLPVDEAIEVCKQITEALESAHEHGVIHRDLKPGNVMVRPDGTVKVLDFGLARAMSDDSTDAIDANSPTITANFTKPGVVLGTASYMSPEQARGRPLDKRTDIWSFGVVLFECLTGKTLFRGETATDSMGAIMHRDPDWSLLPAETPATVRLLLRRCLTKDRKRRLHDIADARIELENALIDPTSTSLGLAQAALEVRHRWLPSWRISIAVAVVVLLAAVGGWFARPQAKDQIPVLRLTAVLPDDQKLADTRLLLAAISPDGTQLAYVATADGESQLYLRHMDQQRTIALGNTTNALSPAYSPDGRWIAFSQQGKLKKISLRGGPALVICDAPQLRGLDWGNDGTLAYAPNRRSGIWIVPASGGMPEQLTDLGPDPGAASHRWPHFLPDGRTVLFTHTDNEDDYSSARIESVSLDTGERKVLVQGATDARFVPTGHLVFVRDNVLMAAAFDSRQAAITGPEVSVLENIERGRTMGIGQYSFSENGVLVYLSGSQTGAESELVWVDHAGKITTVSEHARPAMGHALSPDGLRIAWVLGGGNAGTAEVWLLEIERDMLTRFTFGDGSKFMPVWSPDGLWIYFASDRSGGIAEIYRRKADGTGNAERLTTSDNTQLPWSISPDGRTLVFTGDPDHTGREIMLVHLDQERAVEPFLTTPFSENDPAISPDGAFIAYSSDETGTDEVYVREFPSGMRRVKISPGLAFLPKWSPDGTELFYINGERHFFSVAIDVKDGVLSPGSPKLLFELPSNLDSDVYDVAPDGERFLFSRTQDSEAGERRGPIVVVNWFDELRHKVATMKAR